MATLIATDRDALLRAICLDPADDAPRLLYADACREAGDEDRADFIECQVELARTLPTFDRDESYSQVDNPRFIALQERERELAWVRRQILNELPWTGLDWMPEHMLKEDPQLTNPVAVVRRGWVERVAAPLGVLFGAECEVCEGTGAGACPDVAEYIEIPGGCPRCGGEGRTPGVAAALFAAHPITAVTLTDRGPYFVHGPEEGGMCFWLGAAECRDPFDLPTELVAAIRGRPVNPDDPWDNCLLYDGREEAMEALDYGCVRLGRRLAGLE